MNLFIYIASDIEYESHQLYLPPKFVATPKKGKKTSHNSATVVGGVVREEGGEGREKEGEGRGKERGGGGGEEEAEEEERSRTVDLGGGECGGGRLGGGECGGGGVGRGMGAVKGVVGAHIHVVARFFFQKKNPPFFTGCPHQSGGQVPFFSCACFFLASFKF
jgi:hypothetical protein